MRTLKYLKKRIGKTVLIGIIFLIIANLVLAGLLIREASNTAQEQTMLSIGADVNYSIDFGAVMNSIEKGELDRSLMQGIKNSDGLIESEVIAEYGGATYGNLVVASDSEYVKEYSFDLSTPLTLLNIDEYTLDSSTATQSVFNVNYFDHGYPADFTADKAELVEGTMITDSQLENGEALILISDEVASINKLTVGDVVEVEYDLVENNTVVIQHTIVGIYHTDEEADQQVVQSGNSNLPENNVYVPYYVLTQVGYSVEQLDNIWMDSNVISLIDPSTMDTYIREVESKIDLKFGMLETNEDMYESLVGPIEIIGDISNYAVFAILLTGGLIIGLITALTVNDRKGEIGILLAVGETKLKIVSQFVLEIVIIAVVTFSLSIFTGGIIGDVVSDFALDSDLFNNSTESEQKVIETASRPGTGTGAAASSNSTRNIGNSGKQDTSKYDEEATIEIDLNIEIIALLFGLGISLSIISTIIPALYVMRFNPKQILSNRTS